MSQLSDRDKYLNYLLAGHSLQANQVVELEEKLNADPADLQARMTLLGYYFMTQHGGPEIAKKLATVTIWLIDNLPDCGLFQVWGCLDKNLDPENYEEAKEHWQMQLEKHPDNLRIICGAAEFFQQHDHLLSEELLNKAISLDTNNPELSRTLALLLRLHEPERREDALRAMQDAVKKEGNERGVYYMLNDLAELYFDTGRTTEAGETAARALALVGKFGRDWNDGNAIYTANSILGRVALKDGDVAKAREHLSLAGKTPGSPQLNSFGPDFELAAELFESGERECIVDHLEACREFWKSEMRDNRIERAIDQIRQGVRPDFESRFADYGCDGGTDCDHK
ncbi:MAG: hypothetical protein JST01_10355 [Cyanobacteria bacterium SZAS TMP-1]|nr:hypothetical protein [Cyanobacteria bacterium SZAS TMP-1]